MLFRLSRTQVAKTDQMDRQTISKSSRANRRWNQNSSNNNNGGDDCINCRFDLSFLLLDTFALLPLQLLLVVVVVLSIGAAKKRRNVAERHWEKFESELRWRWWWWWWLAIALFSILHTHNSLSLLAKVFLLLLLLLLLVLVVVSDFFFLPLDKLTMNPWPCARLLLRVCLELFAYCNSDYFYFYFHLILIVLLRAK